MEDVLLFSTVSQSGLLPCLPASLSFAIWEYVGEKKEKKTPSLISIHL